MENVELLIDCQNILGEGVLWNDQDNFLYWTDIESKRFYRWNSEDGDTEYREMPEKLCAFAFRKTGGFLMAFETGLAFWDWDTPSFSWLTKLHEKGGPVRLNDGRCDRQGRFIVGDFDAEEKSRGKAYRIDKSGESTELFGDLDSANSTCFSPDGKTMYYSCAVKGEIWAYDYDPETGIPSGRRLFHSFDGQPGLPDGSTIDEEGFLWNAQWGGSRIVRFNPAGEIDKVVEMPVKNITCLCFGGKDLDTLFVTTARMTLTDEDIKVNPQSGGIFLLKTDCKGLQESRFRG